ncbi:hypothetical protein [Flavobacterium ginsengisoli]
MLKSEDFYFSNLYMTKNYLTVTERQSLNILAEEKKIVLFESGSSFYSFFNKLDAERYPIGLPGMSSVYYAKENNIPIVTKCRLTRRLAEEIGVLVYSYEEMLKLINIQQNQIDHINNLLLMLENSQNN